MVFMKAKEKAKRELSSQRMKQYHADQRVRKAALEEADEQTELPMHLNQGGRRIIDLKLFARSMWCSDCKIPLCLRNLVEEWQYGLASRLVVKCHQCLRLHNVYTSDKVHDESKDGRSLFAVNCKAAIGCLDSGVGHAQLNKLFSAINLPTISDKTIKLAEERVGPSVVAVAKESCKEAITEERELVIRKQRLSLSANGDTPVASNLQSCSASTSQQGTSIEPEDSHEDPDQPPEDSRSDRSRRPLETVDFRGKYDYGWDKRGTGFQYNSHSGRGSLIGDETNKVLDYAVLSNYCAMCARGHDPEDHVCVKNYEGSAKGMEPVAAVRLIVNNPMLEEAGMRLTHLIGDRDSSTMAALRRESPHPIQKILDLNHNIKAVNNPLWTLKKSGYSFLTTDIINYIKRCVMYAIQQNKGNVPAVAAAIMNVKDHIYGNHDNCGEWCEGRGVENYFFKHLPGGKPLTHVGFYSELEKILKTQADQAEQLAPAGSSLQNESFNHMCNTHAPKSRHYCGTSANLYRVSAAVCCKNLGAEQSLERVFKNANLSPSYSKYRQTVERMRTIKRFNQNKPEMKKRRLFLKMKNNWKETSRSNSEGITYCSGMAPTMERAAAAACVEPGWLPEETVVLPTCQVVFVDTETSGLSASASIVQLAAKCGEMQFSVHILPTKQMEPQAAAVTGLKVVAGKLCRNGEVLKTVSEKKACTDFVRFLKSCGSQVIVAGHNLIRFDAPRILKLLSQHGMAKDFCNVVCGLTDTMPIIAQGKMKKQDQLAAMYLQGPEWDPLVRGAHDAMVDCILLDGLVTYFKKTAALKENVVTLTTFLKRQSVLKKKKDIIPTLQGMLEHGVSKCMVNKMADQGVTLEELKEEYVKNGKEGLKVCLGVQINGKPRVTVRKNIIDCVEQFVKSLK